MTTQIDHEARRKHLRTLMDSSHKLRTWDLSEEEEDFWEAMEKDEPEPIEVPHRFAQRLYEGEETLILFHDSLHEACQQGESSIFNDYPSAPGDVTDLDTGKTYESVVTVRYVPSELMLVAQQTLHNLNVEGMKPSAAMRAAGFDPELNDVATEDSSAFDVDDAENTVIDFLDYGGGGVLLRRVPKEQPTQDSLYEWVLETY